MKYQIATPIATRASTQKHQCTAEGQKGRGLIVLFKEALERNKTRQQDVITTQNLRAQPINTNSSSSGVAIKMQENNKIAASPKASFLSLSRMWSAAFDTSFGKVLDYK